MKLKDIKQYKPCYDYYMNKYCSLRINVINNDIQKVIKNNYIKRNIMLNKYNSLFV